MKKVLFGFMIIMLAFIVSCSEDPFGANQPVDIILSEHSMNFNNMSEINGRNFQLQAVVHLKNGKTSSDVEWEVPDDDDGDPNTPSPFTVLSTARGTLTFKITRSGTYIIKAKAIYKDEVVKVDECIISIADALQSINLVNSSNGNILSNSFSMNLNDVTTIQTTYTPSNTSEKNILWEVGDSNIIGVSDAGVGAVRITAKSKGQTTLTAISESHPNIQRKISIIVNETGIEQKFGLSAVEVVPRVGDINVDSSQLFTTTVYDGNANAISSGKINFQLTNTDSFVLEGITDRTVRVKALKAGSGELISSYTIEGQTVETKSSLRTIGDVESMALSSSYVRMAVGDEETIDISYNPEQTIRKGFVYDLANSNTVAIVASNNDSITIRAKALGQTQLDIYSKYNPDLKGATIINVENPVTATDRVQKITLSNNILNFQPPFASKTLDASVYRRADDGSINIDEHYEVTFSIENNEIASINPNGNSVTITALKPGTTKVIATSKDNPNVYSTCDIKVEGELINIIPAYNTLNIKVGESSTVNLSLVPTFAIVSNLTVNTSNDNVKASIVKNNSNYSLKIDAVKTGSSVVSILTNNKEWTRININSFVPEQVVIRSLTLSQNSIHMQQDSDDVIVEAFAYDSKNNPVNTTINIAPANNISTSVASVSRVGNTNAFSIKALNAGVADYVLTPKENDSYVSARLHIEVGGSAIQGTALRELRTDFDSTNMLINETKTVRLTPIPFNASIGNVNWSTSNASIVEVTGNTLSATLIAKTEGSATITAITENNIRASFRINVSATSEIEDTSIAYSVINSTSGKNIVTSTNSVLNLYATAYKSNGTPINYSNFVWSITSGSTYGQLISNTSGTDSVDVRITQLANNYNTPIVVTATPKANLNARTTFTIYAVTNAAQADSIALPKFSSATIEVGQSLAIPFTTIPNTYNPTVQTNISSNIATVSVNNKTLNINAISAGNATIRVLDGAKNLFNINLKVVDRAESKDYSITGVALDRKYLSYDLAKKAPQVIKATVYKNNVVDNTEGVVWSSSDLNVVGFSVNDNSSITVIPKNLGTATLIATSKSNSNVSASCYVEVIDSTNIVEDLRYVMLSETSIALGLNESLKLTASGYPTEKFKEYPQIWTSSNPNVATVSKGTVTANSVGEADITVSVNGLTDTCHVIVTRQASLATASRIRLSSSTVELSQFKPNDSKSVTATVIDTEGDVYEGTVSWTVDNEEIVNTNINGNTITVLPNSAGTTTIRAYFGNLTASFKVFVGVSETAPTSDLEKLTLIPNSLTLKTGTEGTTKVYPYPNNITIDPMWSVANNTIAKATPYANNAVLINALSQGDTIVTIRDILSMKSADLNLRVRDDISNLITSISLDKSAITFDRNSKAMTSLTAKVYVNNTLDTSLPVTWSFHDPISLEEITSTCISFTPTSEDGRTVNITLKGTTEIESGYLRASATDSEGTMYSQALINVIDSSTAPQVVREILLDQTNMQLRKGTSYQMIVRTIPSMNADIRWTIDANNPLTANTQVVSVDMNGKITALNYGTATVKAFLATNPNVSATVNVIVSEDTTDSSVQVGSISLSPSSLILKQDDIVPSSITATVYDVNGKILPSVNVTWDLTELGGIANVENNIGNTLYLLAGTSGSGKLTAKIDDVSASAFVYSGVTPTEDSPLKAINITSSSPIYMVKGTNKDVAINYVPNLTNLKGVRTSINNNNNNVAIELNEDNTSLNISALEATPEAYPVNVYLTSTNNSGIHTSFDIIVVNTASELPSVTELVLDKTNLVLDIAAKADTYVTAYAYNYNGDLVSNARINWSLNDVDSTGSTITSEVGSTTGIIKGTNVGNAILTATCGTISVPCNITLVDTAGFNGITASSNEINLTVGSNKKIIISGTPENMFSDIFVDSFTNQDVINLTTLGKEITIGGIRQGSSSFRVYTVVNGVEYSTYINVYVNERNTDITPSRITIEPNWHYFNTINEVQDFTVRVFNSNNEQINSRVSYSLSNPRVATLETINNGVSLTSKNIGESNLIVTAGNINATAYVAVGEEFRPIPSKLSSILLGANNIVMSKNTQTVININKVPSEYQFTNLLISSSNESIVRVVDNNLTSITLQAVNEGDAVIYVSEGDVMASVNVKVQGKPKAAKLVFDNSIVRLDQGINSTIDLKAHIYDSLGNEILDEITSFTVSESNIAQITQDPNNSFHIRALNIGSTVLTASYGNVSGSVTISVSESSILANIPTSMVADYPELMLSVGKSREVSVIFAPANLDNAGKGILAEISETDAHVRVDVRENGKLNITGLSVGENNILVRSTVKPGLWCNYHVTVVEGDSYRLEVDRSNIRMGRNGQVEIKSTVYFGDTPIEDEMLYWSFLTNDADLSFNEEGDKTLFASNAVVYSNDTIGESLIEVSYPTNNPILTTNIAITVEDMVPQSLTAISLNKSLVTCEVGDYIELEATTIPQLLNTIYSWTEVENILLEENEVKGDFEIVAISDNKIILKALQKGKTQISVSAQLANDSESMQEVISDSAIIMIYDKGELDQTFKYSYLTLDKNTLNISANGNMHYIVAQLFDKDKKVVNDKIGKWVLSDSLGNPILTWSEDGYKYKEEEVKSSLADTSFIEFKEFNLIGTERNRLGLIANKAGIYFLEAFSNDFTVSAKIMITVSGALESINFNSDIIHIVQDQKELINVIFNPISAIYQNVDWIVTSNNEDLTDADLQAMLTSKTNNSVVFTSNTLGEYTLTCTVIIDNNTTQSASMKIIVHDKSFGTGGIKYLQFPKNIVTLGFPYVSEHFSANAYYMDGSVANIDNIIYKFDESKNAGYVLNPNDNIIYKKISAANEGEPIEQLGEKIAQIVENNSRGITIFPYAKATLVFDAELDHKYSDNSTVRYTATMQLVIGGNTNRLNLSANSVILYTGGSASIDISSDNPNYIGDYVVELLEERTSTGYRIINDYLEGSVKKMESIFTNTSFSIENSSLLLATKAFPRNMGEIDLYGNFAQSAQDGSSSMGGIAQDSIVSGIIFQNEDELQEGLNTFPRTAQIRVSTKDGQSSSIINVVINLMPIGNSYPMAISLPSEKIDLTPPFDDNHPQVFTASLFDLQGKSTTGKISWFYYPLGADNASDFNLDNYVFTNNSNNDKDNAKAYLKDNGQTIWLIPKVEGLYTLKAVCVSNPQLETDILVNVGGKVDSVVASCGSTLVVPYGDSTDVYTKFIPEGSLGRQDGSFWGLYSKDSNTNRGIVKIAYNDSVKNEHLRLNFNKEDSIATLTGLKGTDITEEEILMLIYIKDNNDKETLISSLQNNDTFELNNNSLELSAEKSLTVQTYRVSVSVKTTKALYSFETMNATDGTSFDPTMYSEPIKFNVTADNTGEESTSTFKNWEWVEMKIIDHETPFTNSYDSKKKVYASSVPILKTTGESLYPVKYVGDVNGKHQFERCSAEEAELYLPFRKGLNEEKGSYVYQINIDNNLHNLITRNNDGNGDFLSWSISSDNSEINPANLVYTNVTETRSFYNWVETIEEGNGNIRKIQHTSDLIIKNGQEGYYKVRDIGNSKEVVFETIINRENERLHSFEENDNSFTEGWYEETVSICLTNDRTGKIQAAKNGVFFLDLASTNIPTTYCDVLVTTNSDLETITGYNAETMEFYRGASTVSFGGNVRSIIPDYLVLTNESNGGKDREFKLNGNKIYPLFEGTTATLNLAYNPSATHQKDVVFMWKNVDPAVADISVKGNTVIVNAKMLPNNMDSYPVTIDIVSVDNPNVRTDFTFNITSPIKSIMFSVESEKAINNDTKGLSEVLRYRKLGDQYPNTEAQNEAWCYGTLETGAIDAYYIKTKPVPDYNFEFTYSIIKGNEIAELDTSEASGINKGDKAFHFIPKVSNNSLTYGDVVILVECKQINYKKEFTIHYRALNNKIVKNLGNDTPYENGNINLGIDLDDDIVKNNWDVFDSNSNVLGMDCLVLYSGETFDLALIDQFGNDKKWDYYNLKDLNNINQTNPLDANGAIKWRITPNQYTDSSLENNWEIEENNPTFISFKPTEIENEPTNYSKITVRANFEGTGYLMYTKSQLSANGEVSSMTSGIPVYVINKVDPGLAFYVENFTQLNIIEEIPYKLSKAQEDKWYMPTDREQSQYYILDENGNNAQYSIRRGIAYASFSNSGDAVNLFSNVRLRGLQDINISNGFHLGKDLANQLDFLPSPITWVDKDNDEKKFARSIYDIQFLGERGLANFPNIKSIEFKEIAHEGFDKNIKEWILANLIRDTESSFNNGANNLTKWEAYKKTEEGINKIAANNTYVFNFQNTGLKSFKTNIEAIFEKVNEIRLPSSIETLDIAGCLYGQKIKINGSELGNGNLFNYIKNLNLENNTLAINNHFNLTAPNLINLNISNTSYQKVTITANNLEKIIASNCGSENTTEIENSSFSLTTDINSTKGVDFIVNSDNWDSKFNYKEITFNCKFKNLLLGYNNVVATNKQGIDLFNSSSNSNSANLEHINSIHFDSCKGTENSIIELANISELLSITGSFDTCKIFDASFTKWNGIDFTLENAQNILVKKCRLKTSNIINLLNIITGVLDASNQSSALTGTLQGSNNGNLVTNAKAINLTGHALTSIKLKGTELTHLYADGLANNRTLQSAVIDAPKLVVLQMGYGVLGVRGSTSNDKDKDIEIAKGIWGVNGVSNLEQDFTTQLNAFKDAAKQYVIDNNIYGLANAKDTFDSAMANNLIATWWKNKYEYNFSALFNPNQMPQDNKEIYVKPNMNQIEEKCEECDNGHINCDECDNGYIECEHCRGDDICDGGCLECGSAGSSCKSCAYDGKDKCIPCSGDGYFDCPNCESGWIHYQEEEQGSLNNNLNTFINAIQGKVFIANYHNAGSRWDFIIKKEWTNHYCIPTIPSKALEVASHFNCDHINNNAIYFTCDKIGEISSLELYLKVSAEEAFKNSPEHRYKITLTAYYITDTSSAFNWSEGRAFFEKQKAITQAKNYGGEINARTNNELYLPDGSVVKCSNDELSNITIKPRFLADDSQIGLSLKINEDLRIVSSDCSNSDFSIYNGSTTDIGKLVNYFKASGRKLDLSNQGICYTYSGSPTSIMEVKCPVVPKNDLYFVKLVDFDGKSLFNVNGDVIDRNMKENDMRPINSFKLFKSNQAGITNNSVLIKTKNGRFKVVIMPFGEDKNVE